LPLSRLVSPHILSNSTRSWRPRRSRADRH
jgi:hypothetical protein